jgi:NAD(P)-dependent dehydrogenase (short-subunit alcohol dehydrogenase family)
MCKQHSGVIINTGSESGLGRVFGANYCAAKEGIIGLTRAVAKELGRFNVRCNAIRPRAATTIAEGINLKRFLPSYVHSAGIGLALAHPACRRWKCTSPKQLLRW